MSVTMVKRVWEDVEREIYDFYIDAGADIGYIELKSEDNRAEIVYFEIYPLYENKGYGRESMQLLFEYLDYEEYYGTARPCILGFWEALGGKYDVSVHNKVSGKMRMDDYLLYTQGKEEEISCDFIINVSQKVVKSYSKRGSRLIDLCITEKGNENPLYACLVLNEGLVGGRYWTVNIEPKHMDITSILKKDLLDMVVEKNLVIDDVVTILQEKGYIERD